MTKDDTDDQADRDWKWGRGREKGEKARGLVTEGSLGQQ